MTSEENDEIVEEEISLSEYLQPDTPEILEIKSLYNMEEEYGEWLGTIEYAIADYYYNANRELQDKDVISALKNIKQNYDKDISFFKSDLELLIVEDLLDTLEEYPITHHEFKLLFDYVLWIIDNRSWVEDERAYVKWTAYVLGLFSKEEEEDYESHFKSLTSKMGLTDAQADMLLLKKDADEFFEEGGLFEGWEESEVLARETAADDLETGFFLMNDDEKFDFLLENGPEYLELVQSYIADLAEKEDFEKLQAFYKKLSEKEENFFPLHLMMGTIYLGKDPAFAKSCFQETLRIIDTLEEIPEETKEDLRASISLLDKFMGEETED